MSGFRSQADHAFRGGFTATHPPETRRPPTAFAYAAAPWQRRRPLGFLLEVNFDHPKATAGKLTGAFVRSLKMITFSQAYRKPLGQHDQREIRSLQQNPAERPPTRSTSRSVKYCRDRAFS